ncbi:MAG: hypothetical protein PVJ84_15665, partial [Desulfobacteraceae bacterium]
MIGKPIRYFRLPVVLSLIGLLWFCTVRIAMADSAPPLSSDKSALELSDSGEKKPRKNEPYPDLGKQNTEPQISIDFHDMDIHLFIKFISDLTGKNFVIDEDVKGKVTVVSPGKVNP